MSGIFSCKFSLSNAEVKFLQKADLFVKALKINDVFGFISKQTSSVQNASFTSLMPSAYFIAPRFNQVLIKDTKVLSKQPQIDQMRTVTKYSLQKGARKSVKAVPPRFFRLRWGIWIRTIAGRHKKLWKKSNRRRNTLLQHVFCNHTQSKMLDKMVNRFWRVPKYYIDDPYEPYHSRENYRLSKKKPWRPDGVDYE